MDGVVGIVCAAGRGNRLVHVKALIESGAAEKSGTVQVGHQIIAIDNKDVSTCTLDEVAALLRGPVNSTVTLRLLEMREIHIEMERTEEVDDYGNASVGVIWKEGQSEHVVERVVGGGPAAPRKGDRLLKIDGQSLADMNDADIKKRLIGSSGSSIRLDFARGVAHHSVTLSRQALGGNHCSNGQDLAPQPPSMPAPFHQQADKSSQQTYKRLEQGYTSGDQEYQDGEPASHSSEHQRLRQQPLELMPPPSATVVNLQASYDSSQASAGPQSQGVSPNVSPPPPDVKPVGKPIISHSPPPLSIPRVPARTMPPARSTPATSAKDGLDQIGETVRDDDTVKKQLVDIARRLKDELETQAHEIVALKAKHKSEIAYLEDKICTMQQQVQQQQDSYNQNELREQLVRTQAELRQRDSELACVKSVLTRRAEAVLQGDSIKKLDEITSRVESLTEERDALVHRLQQANARAQDLSVARDLDGKSLRAAADATLRWQMQEMESQILELRNDLKDKSVREQDANETIRIQAQALMKEKQQHEHTAAMLDAAKAELQTVKEEGVTHSGVVSEAIIHRDEAIKKVENLKSLLSRAQVDIETLMAEKEDAEGQLQKQRAVYDEAQALWAAEAMSMEERAKQQEDKIAEARQQAEAAQQEVVTAIEHLSQSEQIRQELIADVEATTRRAEQAEERAEKLTDATHQWREQLEHSQRTIDAQAQAYAEERTCSEDAMRRIDLQQTKLDQRERDVESLRATIKEMHQVRAQNEQMSTKMRSYETMMHQIQADAHRRTQYPIRNRQLPYPQLLQMLDDSAASIGSLQSVLGAKDQQLNFMQQKVSEIATIREYAQDTETQLMSLKESLDWKIIAVQQMSVAVDKCKALMRSAGVSEDEIDAISAAVSVSYAHAHMPDDGGSGATTQRSTMPASSTPVPQNQVSQATSEGQESQGLQGLKANQTFQPVIASMAAPTPPSFVQKPASHQQHLLIDGGGENISMNTSLQQSWRGHTTYRQNEASM